MPKAKNIMEKFTLNEVSFVTIPAQTPALAAIMKSGDLEKLSDEDLSAAAFWESLGDIEKNGDIAEMSTSSNEGHEHAINIHRYDNGEISVWVQYAGSGGEEHNHDHQIVRGDDGNLRMTENHGHTHEFDQTKFAEVIASLSLSACKSSQDGTEAGSSGETVGNNKEASMTDIEKANKDLKTQVEDLQKQLATTTALSTMSDATKAHYSTLNDDDKETFLAKSAEDQASDIENLAKADPVIFKSADGDEFRASDDPRLVKMAKDRDADRKELIKSQAATEHARLEKFAKDELPNLPGELSVRAAIVKSVEGISDEKTRDAAMSALKAHNAALSGAFTEVGKSGGKDNLDVQKQADADSKLDELAKAYASENSVDYYTAYDAVAKANPDITKLAVAG